MSSRYLLFLDFDGVICDSVDECFLSSWFAYYRFYLNKEPASVSLAARGAFGLLRPFIRDGEDYLLLHRLIAGQQTVENQKQFDEKVAQAGSGLMQQFKECFYQARNYLMELDFTYWCGLNRLYAHVKAKVAAAAQSRDFYILSTKKPEYIAAILKYHGILFDPGRILYPAKASKYSVIRSVLAARPGYEALFVDDQIDHLTREKVQGIRPYLAAWGYVKKEWLEGSVAVCRPEDLSGLFAAVGS